MPPHCCCRAVLQAGWAAEEASRPLRPTYLQQAILVGGSSVSDGDQVSAHGDAGGACFGGCGGCGGWGGGVGRAQHIFRTSSPLHHTQTQGGAVPGSLSLRHLSDMHETCTKHTQPHLSDMHEPQMHPPGAGRLGSLSSRRQACSWSAPGSLRPRVAMESSPMRRSTSLSYRLGFGVGVSGVVCVCGRVVMESSPMRRSTSSSCSSGVGAEGQGAQAAQPRPQPAGTHNLMPPAAPYPPASQPTSPPHTPPPPPLACCSNPSLLQRTCISNSATLRTPERCSRRTACVQEQAGRWAQMEW